MSSGVKNTFKLIFEPCRCGLCLAERWVGESADMISKVFLSVVGWLGLALAFELRADCFEPIKAIGSSQGSSFNKKPQSSLGQSRPRARSHQPTSRPAQQETLFERPADRVEISPLTQLFLKYERAFLALHIRAPGLSPAEVTIAYRQRVNEINQELWSPKTRLSEDIADLKRDREAADEAFAELVQAGLANPL